ncbi:hamartin protein [Sarocladium implicatum]|nr:hamartin protein [Sarocladium implicatum]
MSSSASLKDLSKAINSFIVDPVLPLPDSLVDIIAGYLDRHQKYDDSASDRLQEELFVIFDKHVKGNPNSYAAWFGIIRRLLPVLQTQERLLQWFDACRGFVDKAPHNKGMITETVAGLMDIVLLAENYIDHSDSDGAPIAIIHRMFSLWMDRFYPASLEGHPNAQHNEKLVREALIQFGKRRPKEFFYSLDDYLVKKQYRKAALRFFCDYVQSRPPHLHQILDSTLFSHLLSCLQLDTSTTATSAALIALIMLLPHMPSSIVPHLPTLFNIYARILFWSRERATLTEASAQTSEQTSGWEVCTYDPETEDTNISHLGNYYTILYGLYPINFMDYIRKPQRYLRHANIASADDIEVQPTEIRHQSEVFRRCHILHPNFYTLTIESEKTDFGRWIKSEAAEVAAECMSLHVSSKEPWNLEPGQSPVISSEQQQMLDPEVEGADPALLSSSVVLDSRLAHSTSADSSSSHKGLPVIRGPDSSYDRPSDRDSGDARTRASVTDSPALSANLAASTSHTHLQDMIQSNKAIKSGLAQSLANDSVPSLALSQQEEKPGLPIPSAKGSGIPTHLADLNARVAQLQRQALLLQNDLTFERYQKQQHMAHIGDLRRRLVSEAASEAETQNLIMTNRGLKSRFEEAKKAEMQVRRESEKGRTMAKNRENDIYNKLRAKREEVKKVEGELEATRSELEQLQTENQKLRKLILDAEARESKWQQHKEANEMHIKEVERLKMEVSRLSLVEREFQGQEQEMKSAIEGTEAANSRAESFKKELEAHQSEVQRLKREFDTQLESLSKQLAESLASRNGARGQISPEVEKLLKTSREKESEMKRKYDLLSRKYTAVQSSLLDMQSMHVPASGRFSGGSLGSPDSTDANLSLSPTSMTARRPPRILSETDLSGALSNAATPSVDGAANNPGPGRISGEAVAEQHPTSSEQRYFGRGGVQNRSRGKDAKDGKAQASREESPAGTTKKEKKSGLRGIRGLV